MTMDDPITSRMARSTSTGNRQRFSIEPPYSSSRLLVSGERKYSSRSSWFMWSSTPSRRAFWACSAQNLY